MVLQLKSSSNGSLSKSGEQEEVSNKAQSVEPHSANTAFSGEAESLKRLSRDRLLYLTACTIGNLVEVHLKNGSVYSGIFHAADVDKDFGIILKMASLVREGFLRGHKSRFEFVRKPPYMTFIIPADELVQVVAKNISISSDDVLNAVPSEKPVELLTDSSIPKSYHVGQGKELEPWVPDDYVPQGMENVFDKHENRGWNQFEVNESLFGVTSTFNEELYTTKLERGAQTRELEEQAQRIAREIEGENTQDLHVAEERGHQINEKFDIDEETKYSSVRPLDGVDDSGFDEEDDKQLDAFNDQTFGGPSTSDGQNQDSSSGLKPASSSVKGYEELQGDSQHSRNIINVDPCSISDDRPQHFPSEQRSEDFPASGSSMSESQLVEGRNNNNPEVSHSNKSAEESGSGHGASASETAAEKETQVNQVSGKRKPESSSGQPDSRSVESRSAPSTSSQPEPSPSGSMTSSEQYTFNRNAKKFPRNPSVNSFKSRQPAAPARPQPPPSDVSFYYTPDPVQQMPESVGYGIQQQYQQQYPGQQQQQQQMMYYPGQQRQQQQMMYYPGQQQQLMIYHVPEQYYVPGQPQPLLYYPVNAGQPQYPQPQQMVHGQPPFGYIPRPPPPYEPENQGWE